MFWDETNNWKKSTVVHLVKKSNVKSLLLFAHQLINNEEL